MYIIYNTKVYPFQRGDRLYTSESDVCRHQILTYEDSPALKELKYF